METVHGLGNEKNQMVLQAIADTGVHLIPGSLRYLEAVRDAGLARAVVSASVNCRPVLAAAGIETMMDVVVDGLVAAREQLPGKPAPDTYLGVAVGRAGHFGWVIGVDRGGEAAALRAEGADVVVTNLTDLLDSP